MLRDFWESVGDTITFKAFAKKGEIGDILSQILPESVTYRVKHDACDNAVTIDFSKVTEGDKRSYTGKVFQRLDSYIYSEVDISLAEHVINLLKLNRKTLGVTESLTGGMIADAIVSIKGASEVFSEGLVCYSNSAKMLNLKVKESTLAVHTAVSEETAYEMVRGILSHPYNDFGIATTGYAENYGGENGGTVYVAIGDSSRIDVHKYAFTGDRQEVRKSATNAALFHLAKKLRGSFN